MVFKTRCARPGWKKDTISEVDAIIHTISVWGRIDVGVLEGQNPPSRLPEGKARPTPRPTDFCTQPGTTSGKELTGQLRNQICRGLCYGCHGIIIFL